MTTKFKGESTWDAIISDNGLDIEEEESFLEYCEENGCNEDSSLEDLTYIYEQWKEI